jgi:ATP-dependent DNA ligase
MKLPIALPFAPMEAKIAAEIPAEPGWQYEPKWDGFRCIALRDGQSVELQSKAGQPLTRYFPEVVAALKAVEPRRFVLDGELIVPLNGRLSFDDLLQRIHPAASRVKKLSETHPAEMVVFDLLADEKGAPVFERPLMERRPLLEAFYNKYLRGNEKIVLSQVSQDEKAARNWLKEMRGQLDGIVAKKLDEPYRSGERAMLKIKTARSADCVVGGFRYATGKRIVGSLLLGLYDTNGLLNHVGFTSGFAATDRRSLTTKLRGIIEPPGFTGQAPGGPSRWSTERSAAWEPVKPVLVVEVQYDHFTGARFRHGTKLLRWRPDKNPHQCTLKQVQFESKVPFARLLAT